MAIMVRLIIVFGSSFIISLFSCKYFSGKDDYKAKIVEKSQSVFVLDTSINEIKLRDTTDIIRNFGDTKDFISNDFNRGELFIVSSKKSKQFFSLRKENGGFRNQFDYFYIDQFDKQNLKTKPSTFSLFKSNKGAFIGMNDKDFLKNYSDFDFKITTKNDTTIYYYYNGIEPYEAEYVFTKGSLKKFQFGYTE